MTSINSAGLASQTASKVNVSIQDVTTDRTGTFVPLTDLRGARVTALAYANLVEIGENLTVQIVQATDASGTGVKALTDVVTSTVPDDGLSPTESVETTLTAAVDAMVANVDRANGFTHIAVKVTCSDSGTVNGGAVLIEDQLRFAPA